MGGGIPFCMLSTHQTGFFFPPLFPSSNVANFQPIGANFQPEGAKVNKFLVCFGVFSGIWETKKGKNKNLFYFRGFRGAAFILFCGGGGGVHWVQVVQGAGLPVVFRGVCSIPLSLPLSLCCFCFPAIPAKYALFRILRGFLAGFMWFVWVCIAWVLCVACAAFVRVYS